MKIGILSKFTLRQLELFVALEDYPTLSEAAASLHFSESALSQAITRLETSVGEQLCIRRKARGLQLTPTGQYFAVRARKLLNDAQELIDDIKGEGSQLRGPVKLGCFSSFATSMIPDILAGFPKVHPGVTVEVTVGGYDVLLPALRGGQLDLALVYDMELPAGFQRRGIFATELQAVLPVDHPLAAQESVDLAELAPEPLIMYDMSPGRANTMGAFDRRGLVPNVVINMPQIILVQALVGRGLGYGLLMSRPDGVSTTVEGRPLAVRPVFPPVSQTTISGIWPEHSTLSTRAQALLDFTVETFKDAGTGVRAQ